MSKVYVKWYGRVLEGELLDGDYLGMKQVVIPLDGHKPIAMFAPEHVYDSPDQIAESTSMISTKAAEISTKPEIVYDSDVLPADDRQMIEAFKRENWDTERNHLRIDKLDEFYQLWRMVMRPSGFVEATAPVTLPSHKEEPKPVAPKPSKKMLRSTGVQQFNNATQLSLFEL